VIFSTCLLHVHTLHGKIQYTTVKVTKQQIMISCLCPAVCGQRVATYCKCSLIAFKEAIELSCGPAICQVKTAPKRDKCT
jgi:hypothetical protein